MRYDVGRFRRPMRRSTEGQLASLVSLGDGSTLNLDFTTGVLDPRLTFTRTSNATFINSSGLVQYADHNLATNTVFANTGTDVPTSWTRPAGTGTSGSNGTFVDGNEEWTQTAALTERPYLSQNITISLGLTYTCSVYLASAPSGLEARNIIWPVITTGSTQYYQDGVAITSSTVITPGRISVVFTPTSGSTVSLRVGLGCTNGNTVGTAVFSRPMLIKGDDVSKPYIASTTSPYQAPRFDHDPTTLAPRGLLIEGAAINLAPNSNLQAAWLGGTNRTITPNTTDVLSPDGTNNAAKVALTSASYCSVYEAITGLANATTYTFSYWIRGTAGNQQRIYSLTQVTDLVTQTTLTYTNTGWTRIQVTFTSGAANNTVFIYPVSRPTGTVNDVLYIYGCQLETGSGASSLIPTGASQVTRNADECSMSSTNFAIGSWYTGTQGTLFTDVEYTALSGNQSGIQLADNSGSSETNRLSIRRNIAIATRANVTARQFAPTGTGRAKSAFTYGTADYRFAQNGSTFSAVAGDNGAPPNSIDRMRMFGPGPTQIYGWLRQIKFWPTSLPQATINNLTTL